MTSNVNTTVITPERAATLTSFMTSFYATSDNPTAHEEYAGEYFTKDATLIMGARRAEGYEEILATRKSLWVPVSSRKHTVSKIFFGGESDIVLYGKVVHDLKPASPEEKAKSVEIDWAGKVEFDDSDGKPKMKYYQVYLDPPKPL